MPDERLGRAESIFNGALALAREQRSGFVAQRCAGDEALRRQVETLFALHETHGGALGAPARALGADLLTLRPGEHVGPYEVVKLIGAGGMGEVYEAHDARLDRRVAIKVLPAWSAVDPHRAWRFEQEARAAAALKHPNVVAVFDVGKHGTTPFIVSELLEGENLRERMQRQPLTPRQAAQLAAQVARGLAAAHGANVVHRDLKPENIFLTRDGQVKILDFGLAKLRPKNALLGQAGATMAASVAGQVVGTVGYMAPEQVRGEDVDGRTDLFAVGAILYEVLSGRQPFLRGSVVETLNAILTVDPEPLQQAVPQLPQALARITHRCLEKNPGDRFQSAADLAFALETPSDVAAAPADAALAASAMPQDGRWRLALAWITVAAALTALGLLLGHRLGARMSSGGDHGVYRMALTPPRDTAWGSVPVVSPDGRRLAFVGVKDEETQLYLQPIDSRTATPVAGTTGAMNPFWSPDGRRVGFMASVPGVLSSLDLRVVAEDGTVGPVVWSGLGRGAAFASDGSFVTGTGRSGLIRLSAGGSQGEAVLTLDHRGLEYGQRWPWLLPDGRHVLYFSWRSPDEYRGVYVARVDVPPAQQRPRLVLRGDSNAVFVAGDEQGPAVLVFERDGTIYAQRFDERALALAGTPVAIEREGGRLNPDHPAQFSVSARVMVVGPEVPLAARFTMVGRDGTVDRPIGGVGVAWPRLSPDGRELLHGQLNQRSGDLDLWLLDLERDVGTRLTAKPGFSGWPVWSPDGRQVAYRYELHATAQLRVRSLDGGEGADRVLDARRNLRPVDWSPDGRWILVVGPSVPPPPDMISPSPGGPRSGLDILAMPAQGGEPVPLRHSDFNESEARIAPNGRLFTYVSDVSGRPEVYVDWFVVGSGQSRPAGGPWRVSPDGADFPVWIRGGRELVYFGADDRFYSVNVDVTGDRAPQLGRPVPLPVPYGRRFFPPLIGVHYAVSADGQRFVLTPERGKVTEPMRAIVNWRTLLQGN